MKCSAIAAASFGFKEFKFIAFVRNNQTKCGHETMKYHFIFGEKHEDFLYSFFLLKFANNLFSFPEMLCQVLQFFKIEYFSSSHLSDGCSAVHPNYRLKFQYAHRCMKLDILLFAHSIFFFICEVYSQFSTINQHTIRNSIVICLSSLR